MTVNPERLAQQILEKFPSKDFTNIEAIVKEFGIRVYFTPFVSGEISGIYTRIGNVPVIGINSDHPKARQRFTIAHELFHYLKSPNSKQVMRMSSTVSDSLEERQACRFAASILMPEERIEAFKGKSAKAMARIFGVSRETMEIRLKELE